MTFNTPATALRYAAIDAGDVSPTPSSLEFHANSPLTSKLPELALLEPIMDPIPGNDPNATTDVPKYYTPMNASASAPHSNPEYDLENTTTRDFADGLAPSNVTDDTSEKTSGNSPGDAMDIPLDINMDQIEWFFHDDAFERMIFEGAPEADSAPAPEHPTSLHEGSMPSNSAPLHSQENIAMYEPAPTSESNIEGGSRSRSEPESIWILVEEFLSSYDMNAIWKVSRHFGPTGTRAYWNLVNAQRTALHKPTRKTAPRKG